MTARPMRSSMHSIKVAGRGPIPAKTTRFGPRHLLVGFAVIALLSCVAGARRPNSVSQAAAPTSAIDEPGGVPEASKEAAEPESSGDAHSAYDDAPPPRVRQASGKYSCESPRPRVCDATPNPVCAQVQESKSEGGSSQGEPVTVLNGCLACADPGVVSYVEGRCTATKTSSAPSPSTKR